MMKDIIYEIWKKSKLEVDIQYLKIDNSFWVEPVHLAIGEHLGMSFSTASPGCRVWGKEREGMHGHFVCV